MVTVRYVYQHVLRPTRPNTGMEIFVDDDDDVNDAAMVTNVMCLP